MKKLLHTLTLLGASLGILTAQHIPVHHIYFEHNQTRLSSSNKILLDRLYEKLPSGKKVKIEVFGTVDLSMGASYYNDIDKLRAQQVQSYLKQRQIECDLNLGERQEHWHRSSYNNKIQPETRNYSIITVSKNFSPSLATTQKLSTVINKTPEKRFVDPTVTSILKFAHGIKIEIPPAAFACNKKIIEEKLQLEVTVYYSNADIIAKDLITASNDRPLESGGMLYVSANCRTCESENIALVKPVTAHFPTDEHKPEMQYFRGEPNASNDINWIPTGNYDQSETQALQEQELMNEEMQFDEGILDGVYYSEETNKLDSYMLEVTSLGWINCDRFYEEPNTQNMFVQSDTSLHPYVRLVFPDIKSVMSAYPNKYGVYTFTNVPNGKKAVLIAYAVIDSKAYYIQKDIVIGKRDKEDVIPTQMSVSEVKTMLARLN